MKRMHLSPSSSDAEEPLRTNCGLSPLLGPRLFTNPDLKVCRTCEKVSRKKGTWRGVEYVDGKWRTVRLAPIIFFPTPSTSSSAATVTWKFTTQWPAS